jgi:hypothetical protein
LDLEGSEPNECYARDLGYLDVGYSVQIIKEMRKESDT